MLKKSLGIFTLAFAFVSGVMCLPAFSQQTADTVKQEQQDDKMKDDKMAGDKMADKTGKKHRKHRKHRKHPKHTKSGGKMEGDKMSDDKMKKP